MNRLNRIWNCLFPKKLETRLANTTQNGEKEKFWIKFYFYLSSFFSKDLLNIIIGLFLANIITTLLSPSSTLENYIIQISFIISILFILPLLQIHNNISEQFNIKRNIENFKDLPDLEILKKAKKDDSSWQHKFNIFWILSTLFIILGIFLTIEFNKESNKNIPTIEHDLREIVVEKNRTIKDLEKSILIHYDSITILNDSITKLNVIHNQLVDSINNKP